MDNSPRFKMYKDGKKWVVGAFAVAGLMALQACTTQASADEVQSGSSNSATTAVNTQDNGLQADQVKLTPSSSADTSAGQSATASSEASKQASVSVSSPEQGKQIIDDNQKQVDDSAKTAEGNGVVVNHNDAQDVHLNKGNAQVETNKVVSDLQDQKQKVDEANALQQANQQAYDKANTDRDDAISKNEQDLNDAKDDQQKQISDSKDAGVDTTITDVTVSPEYKDLTGLTGQDLLDAMASNIAVYEQAMQKAVSDTNSDTAKLKELTEAYKAQVAHYQAEKARIEKENADKKAAYEKALQDFMNGTNISAHMDARTDTDMGSGQYQTFMNADVNAQTGEFTLSHDMNDGVNVIGRGFLTGKVVFSVTSNGDGTETVTVAGIELYNYRYENYYPNSANNQNINFHVYDNNGNELYSKYHNGSSSFSEDINKTFGVNAVYTLTPGQQSDFFSFLKIDDNWIWNTHGQVMINFQNTNEQPPLPEYEPLPTEPVKVTGQVSNYLVYTLPMPEAPKPQEVTVTPYNVIVDPEPVTPAPAQPEPVKPVQASLPETGMEAGLGLSGLGFALLSGMAAYGASKKRKQNGEA